VCQPLDLEGTIFRAGNCSSVSHGMLTHVLLSLIVFNICIRVHCKGCGSLNGMN
jgi:hypothetical protein